MPVCTDCGGTVIEYDSAAGNGFCVKCGTVIEENTIVNEVAFGETSNGAAMVQGSFVGQGATHARMSGPYGNRGSNESREQTIANASRKIQSIANVMRLSDIVCLAATRMYTLAVEHKFTKGRKSLNVVAVCLYVACRQKETRTYMLIDFSDLLQVNVFELGHIYLQLVQTLNLRLPLVDPAHYISRFASLLEFGDETHRVATDAVRLVQRFDRDWMTRGRRPAGICGAALLLAARMNNFRRSVEEIVQVVKIADTTLRKRLEEFKASPSGGLTLVDFRTVWLEEEMDPPAFTKGREKEEKERERAEQELEAGENEEQEGGKKGKDKSKGEVKKKKRKRKRGQEEEGEEQDTETQDSTTSRVPVDLNILNDGILAGTLDPSPLFIPEIEPTTDSNIDPALLSQPFSVPSSAIETTPCSETTLVPTEPPNPTPLEVSSFLHNQQGASLASALEEREERRRAERDETVDELEGLDEEELDRFLLSEDEVKIKERVWVELNREYLEAIAAKGEMQDSGSGAKSRKRRKTKAQPRDASTPHGSTAAESVRTLLKKHPKYSKRINYDALKDLFIDGPPHPSMRDDDDDKEDDLYDDKSDGEGIGGMVLIEEEGSVGVKPNPVAKNPGVHGSDGKGIVEEDAEGDVDVDYGSDKDDEVGWDDGYEQEI
ncbi:hypothetical protein BD779DRAFT_1799037 [Infundibulicybe gibba]|nr:hypothetical protein BD779DRAFT_1799037 [Infundibulicybe gibba]